MKDEKWLGEILREVMATAPEHGSALSENGKKKIEKVVSSVKELLNPETTGGEIVEVKAHTKINCVYITAQFDCLDIAEKELEIARNIMSEIGGLSIDVNVNNQKVRMTLGVSDVYEK